MSKYLDMAVEVARQSKHGRYLHGAVIVKDGKVLASATNKTVGPAVPGSDNAWRRAHIHAEMAALAAAGSRAAGASIYIARLLKNGETSNSMPCKKCYGAIKRAGITRIVAT